MELIIKPTGACNFNCKFCSAYGLDIKHDPDNVLQALEDLILKLKPYKMIITGGEPLMMTPEYYYKLHEIGIKYNPDVKISMTTNLKDFYLYPEKWIDLFKEDWMGVGTSFQYGDKRMWDPNTPYSEEMFLKVIDKFCTLTGKTSPPFIATIDETNENRAIDHVLLAQSLNTVVKINNVLGMGAQKTTYPRYKLFRIFLYLLSTDNLWRYEANCLEMRASKCPLPILRSCRYSIRGVYIDNHNKLHLSTCDDLLSLGKEFDYDVFTDPCAVFPEDPKDFITEECSYCDLCRLCNRCYSQRIFAKQDPDYCKEMKKIKDDIMKAGWLL